MALAMAREAWTDERLDDLNERVASIDRRMEAGFAEMRAEFKETRQEIASVRRDMAAQFTAQHRTTIQLFGGMWVTAVVGFLGVIATIITQT
jgi:hypothetical protein